MATASDTTWMRRLWAAVAMLLAALLLAQPAAAGLGPPRYAAILVDPRTGETLYANAADELRHPASITKIMTLYLAFDALVDGRLRLGDPIVISRHAAAQRPSRLGLAPGQTITLDDAIRVITVKSANDLAVAVAERIGGTEENFAAMMTRKARTLGMTNTNFTNASGLSDAGNVTTARDIATLSVALLRNHPSYYVYFSQRGFSYQRHNFANHNHLLGKLTGMDGIKTGYTVDAGFTLAASAQRDGRRLIAVVLGEPSIAARNRDVSALLDAGFGVLDKRRDGEETSVAANLPDLNHPALRIAALSTGGEQGSRNDVATVRRLRDTAVPARKKAIKAERSAKAATKKGRKAEEKSAAKSTKSKKGERSAARDEKKGKAGKAAKLAGKSDKAKAKHEKLASAKTKGKKSAAAEKSKKKRSA